MDFQHFVWVGPGSRLMRLVVLILSEEDILDITAYVASLQPERVAEVSGVVESSSQYEGEGECCRHLDSG